MAPTAEQLVRDLRETFEDFRRHNDQRLEEIERNGAASGETDAAVERANTRISELQASLEERQESAAADAARIQELEERLNRQGLGGRGAGRQVSDQRREHYARWQTALQGTEVDPSDVNLEFIADYGRGFREYLATGRTAIFDELQVSVDPDGGVWVDPDTTGRMVEFIYETSPMRRLASSQTIGASSDALEGTVELGEAGFGWVGEQESRPETDTSNVYEYRIPLMEQYANPRTTQRVLDMARIDVGAWLEGKVRRRLSRGEATAFVTGNGEKRPRGFTTYANASAPGDTAETWQRIEQIVSGAAADLTSDGLIDLVYALKTDYRDGAVFGMNRLSQRDVRKLVINSETGNYIWQPDFSQGPGGLLLGYPVESFEDMADVGASALPVVFGQFEEAYQIIDSPLGIRVLRDPYTTKGKVHFYTTRYVGGDVINFEALKLQEIST